jgi:transposase
LAGQPVRPDHRGRRGTRVRRRKKITGRKRHLLVDTLGLIWALLVTPADVQDRDAAKPLLEEAWGRLPRLQVIWADGAYAAVAAWVKATLHWALTTGLRPVRAVGFVVLPKRWIVERTFAWLCPGHR